MPSQGSLSNAQKNKVKESLPASNYKILTATLARVYYATPDPDKWIYQGLEGGLALVFHKDSGSFYFMLVDLDGTRTTIWKHELYQGFLYYSDRPFFHSFPSDDFMIGFAFTDEKDAQRMFKKVNGREKLVGSAGM
ncbi:hypothetical protein FRC02_004577 [Tulasnella sp. 418]|nr:hypothetical protein FRC02_004577 [Tulasnella sp. 418]